MARAKLKDPQGNLFILSDNLLWVSPNRPKVAEMLNEHIRFSAKKGLHTRAYYPPQIKEVAEFLKAEIELLPKPEKEPPEGFL